MSIARIFLVTTCLALVAAPLAAAPAASPTTVANAETTSFFGEMMSIVLPLAFIILVLLMVLRLARRRYGVNPQDAPLSVVQVLPLGPRERIVLVRTRTGRVFAVGVGGQSVRLLTDLDPAELVPKTTPGAPDGTVAGRPKVFGWPLTRRDPPPAASGRGRDPAT